MLDVKPVAQCLDEVVDDQRFCRGVGVESPTAGTALLDFYLAGAGVEVAVIARNLVEDVLEVVSLGSCCLKGVGLDDQ